MKQSEHAIRLVGDSGEVPASVRCFDDHRKCRVEVEFLGKVVTAEASDFFEAFAQVRRELEPQGYLAACFGGALNVYPSGMARDMGRGKVAYQLQLGTHTKGEDLVPIFESTQDLVPASVDDQRAFFAAWIDSIRPQRQ